MAEEVPIANPSMTVEERAAVDQLSNADIQMIDATIFANCRQRWLKVASVVAMTADGELRGRYPGLSYLFYAERLRQLAQGGRLESQGNLLFMRFSEVRLPS